MQTGDKHKVGYNLKYFRTSRKIFSIGQLYFILFFMKHFFLYIKLHKRQMLCKWFLFEKKKKIQNITMEFHHKNLTEMKAIVVINFAENWRRF